MKSYCKGLEIDSDIVGRAYDLWLTRPSGKKNAWRVEAEHGGRDALVDEIVWEVVMRDLTLAPIRRYEHVEPTNGKVREIGIESVKQQVCDYVAILALGPLLDAKIGFYQVAGIEGKGQRLCRGAMRRWVRDARYHVKADVRKCYPSIAHGVVMRILRKYVRSADVLYLCETLLATYDRGGLEIGSYFSLCMANLVLSFAYHHVEGLHKERRGKRTLLVAHQIWHMDDVLLIGRDKRDLRRAVRSLERYLRDELGLSLKPWKICRTSDSEPLDMGGWVVRARRCTVRGGIFVRGTRAFRSFRKSPCLARARRCASYWGWFVHGDCQRARRRRGIDRDMARARFVMSRHVRLETCHGENAIGDTA